MNSEFNAVYYLPVICPTLYQGSVKDSVEKNNIHHQAEVL